MPFSHTIAEEVADMGVLAGIFLGILQILSFFVILKIGQIVYWNVRKWVRIHAVVLELILAVLFVIVLHAVSQFWALLILVALALGVIRGDQEELAQEQRSRLH
jgi:predicted lysophospholipase L1 biosynthesis ABC-type transport system permease subunit